MNIGGDEFAGGGLNRELRFDREEAMSIALSNHTNGSSPSLSLSSRGGGSFGSLQRRDANKNRNNSPTSHKCNSPKGSSHHYQQYEQAVDDTERDFYKNPTVLSRMILFQKYANANKRCRDRPEESYVWVCAKRKTNAAVQTSPLYMFDKKNQQQQQQQQLKGDTQSNNQYIYSLRQLPIHQACSALAYSQDATSRAELEQLVVRLIVTYPEGCAKVDHSGKLPLHLVLNHERSATPETIAMLLMAAPHSIEQMDGQGRTAMDLNSRRMAKDKADIRDMLLLGVQYWEQARQEARLRMKHAVIPPSDQSVSSMSVMGTSQFEKETIYTTDTDNFDSSPLVVEDDKAAARIKQHRELTSEEITPMSWEQLEQRVILLERLLAEMHETNYNLAGVVQELKKTKMELAEELKAAKALTMTESPPTKSMGKSGGSPAPCSSGSASVVPEDDEVSTMSSVKFIEHSGRIEKLESLVGSYHSKMRQKKLGGGGSRVSELSFCSSDTGTRDAIMSRRPSGSYSLVSGLTTSDDSYVGATVNAVIGKQVSSSPEQDDGGEEEDEEVIYSDMREVAQELETDNLSEMFHKVAGAYGSMGKYVFAGLSTPIAANQASRKPEDAPIRIPSKRPLTTSSQQQQQHHGPSMDIFRWQSSNRVKKEHRSSSSSSSFSSSSSHSSWMSEQSREEPPREPGEIHLPGFPDTGILLDPAPANVNSTISISSASTDKSSDESMTENSFIISEASEFFVARNSESVYDEAETKESMSTRQCLERMGFVNIYEPPRPTPGRQQVGGVGNRQQQRSQSSFNFDISIPALNTTEDIETGSI